MSSWGQITWWINVFYEVSNQCNYYYSFKKSHFQVIWLKWRSLGKEKGEGSHSDGLMCVDLVEQFVINLFHSYPAEEIELKLYKKKEKEKNPKKEFTNGTDVWRRITLSRFQFYRKRKKKHICRTTKEMGRGRKKGAVELAGARGRGGWISWCKDLQVSFKMTRIKFNILINFD